MQVSELLFGSADRTTNRPRSKPARRSSSGEYKTAERKSPRPAEAKARTITAVAPIPVPEKASGEIAFIARTNELMGADAIHSRKKSTESCDMITAAASSPTATTRMAFTVGPFVGVQGTDFPSDPPITLDKFLGALALEAMVRCQRCPPSVSLVGMVALRLTGP